MDDQTLQLDMGLNLSKTIKVLLIDDQAIVAEGIKDMLSGEEDIELHYSDDPANAITLATELQPTVILQDLVLPDVDGMTLVRFYRGNDETKNIPIIVLSSKEDPAVKRDAFQYGANDYLVKLPDKIELIARIRSHAKQYMLQLERNAAFFALSEMQKQLEKTNAELERLSSLDSLTQLANRRIFDTTLEQEIETANRENNPLTLILIDIDFFKLFNDTYGHLKGDGCLTRVAEALKKIATRPADLVARYGGEEFAVIAPSTDEAGAMKLANNLNQAISSLKIEHGPSSVSEHVSISLGVYSCIPDSKSSSACFIKCADKALYFAKENGRNHSELYTNDHDCSVNM